MLALVNSKIFPVRMPRPIRDYPDPNGELIFATPTAIAFAFALRLSLDETTDLLRKAGFALSHSSKFDVIVEYFIVSGRYDLNALNEALYEFDQPLINV